jgi:tRNA(fMet)-specific endonuclease VapC
MKYLLDTNVISDFARGDRSVQHELRAHAPSDLAVSTVTVMEVDYGLAIAPGRRRAIGPVLDAMFDALHVLPFTAEDARAAGLVRAGLRKAGRPIGPYDVMLAGCALARGLVLVTANVAEFERVSSLVLENWRATR